MEGKIRIDLSKDEAIVLFEFLSSFSDKGTLQIVDQAEERVLWNLCCDLEKALGEPFLDTYPTVLKKSRKRVRDTE
ncbi:MAG: hypothetical protein KF685_02305 [Acidobacteria bacterium]|nr:hypothetical protein [Acidobacteriota bacterium]